MFQRIFEGSLETVEGFEPRLKSTLINGTDKAVRSSTDDTLQLNVTANLQYVLCEHKSPSEAISIPDCADIRPRVCDDRGTALDKNVSVDMPSSRVVRASADHVIDHIAMAWFCEKCSSRSERRVRG